MEGSQGPAFADTACSKAIDDDEDSSWAVRPEDVQDPFGAGSFLSVTLVKMATVTAMRYKQVCMSEKCVCMCVKRYEKCVY